MVADYFQSLTPTPLSWMEYEVFIFRTPEQFYKNHVFFYRAIRKCPKQKIYVCNRFVVEGSRALLNIDTHIEIDERNWFEMGYEPVLAQTIEAVRDPENVMILTSAGMGAKVLIADLVQKFPRATIIDVGSALEQLCAKRSIRDFHVLTETELEKMRVALLED